MRTVSAHFSLPYYTQSVVYLYTLCVYGYGAAFRRPVFCPAFLKSRERLSGFAAGKAAKRRTDSRFAKPRISLQGRRFYSFCFCKKNQKAAARTCKKLPVASFCASETAETGRIANGCEQGDHVSRSRQVLRPWFKALQRNAFYRNCSGSCLKQFLGFEPVQKGCCTSDARPMFFRKWDIALQAHRGECIRKG